MTVLFADAVGSTPFTEREGDEAAYRFVQACVRRMSEAIERHGGMITQFRGDGVMALFGAPVARERSAVEAVAAALEIQASLGDLRDRCDLRIGLSTGPVIVGRIGDDVLLEYTAVGDTANVAARMEQSAAPGSVLMSESTWRAVREYVDCRPVGPMPVKGKQEPVVAYQALRRRQVRSRLDAAVERGLGPFVGRSRELDLLMRMVDGLAAGQGSTVEIIGEAGVGKSRLLLELRHRLPDGVTWLEGHCSAGAEDAAYLPVADLLRHAFGVEEHDDPATVAKRIDEATSAWSTHAQVMTPYLKYVLDVDPGDPAVEEMDARMRRAAITDALRAALSDAGRRGPRVVVIEDVHWSDSASRDALRALAETAPTTAVLFVITSRPGYATPLGERSRHTRLALDSLPVDATIDITADVLDVESVEPEVAAFIMRRTEGNPLFVEELIASLVESGLIVADQSTCRLTRAATDIDIPATLHDVILARIDRLAAEARDALQLASVIGREFTVRLLDRLTTLPDGLDDTLEELKAVELIRQKAWFPELAYLFKHALTHEVTYATLLDERRRHLHRLVAQAIEEVYADRLAEHVEALARHWLVAEEWDKAVRYLDQAGERAAAAFANDAAVGFFSEAAAIAERCDDPARAAALLARVGDVCLAVGDLTRAVETFDRVTDLARRAHDSDRLAWALALRGEALCYLHDWEHGEPSLLAAIARDDAGLAPRQHAAALVAVMRAVFGYHRESGEIEPLLDGLVAQGVTDPRALGQVAATSCIVPRWKGDYSACFTTMTGNPPETADLLLLQAVAWERAMVYGDVGRYDDALLMLHEAIQRSERGGELLFRARVINTVGWLHGDLGDIDGSVRWNERCLAFLREVDIPDEEIESNARLNLAETWLSAGRLDLASRQLERVEEIVRGKPLRGTWMLWRFSQRLHLLTCMLRLARGETADVAARLADCRALAEESSNRKYLVKASRISARLLGALGDYDEAVAEASHALAAADSLGHPPERWRAHTELARCAQALGDTETARRHRADADAVLASIAVTDPGLRAGVGRLREALRGSR